MKCPFRKITTVLKYPERASGFKLYFAKDVVTEEFADCLTRDCPYFVTEGENYCSRVNTNYTGE